MSSSPVTGSRSGASLIDLRAFPGVVTMTRLISAADQALTLSAQRNAEQALRLQASSRRDFTAQEDDWLTGLGPTAVAAEADR